MARAWSSGCVAPEPLLEPLPQHPRVHGSLSLPHQRSQENSEQLLLAGTVPLDLRLLRLQDAPDGGLDRARVVRLLEAQLLHARLRLAPGSAVRCASTAASK